MVAEFVRAEAVRVAETQVVRETRPLAVMERVAALVEVRLGEVLTVPLPKGEREAEGETLREAVALTERLPRCTVALAQEDREGVARRVVEAVELPPPPPPARVGVEGMVEEAQGEGVVLEEAEGLREMEGRGL